VLVRHVLVDSQEVANQVYTLLTAGQDFAKVAKDFSTDTGSASTGGVYDWAPASNYVPEFKEAVLTQKIGEIGKPVKTQYGYHVIQVIGRQELPLSDSQFEQTVQTAFNDWLTKARDAATKTINDVWKTRVPTDPVLSQQ
jgi:peptidyl-prolyl cis-trans isomerase C/foldase protein PrsA